MAEASLTHLTEGALGKPPFPLLLLEQHLPANLHQYQAAHHHGQLPVFPG